MLKNIPSILSPDLLKILAEMGHGDEIVIADSNFPAASIARHTASRKLIRLDGHGVPAVLEGILKVFPLDQYVKKPAVLMQVDPGDTVETPIWDQYRKIVKASGEPLDDFELMEHPAFNERAKNAYAVVATGELSQYANVILRKGCVISSLKENKGPAHHIFSIDGSNSKGEPAHRSFVKRGFTLVELLVVISIIALLMAVLLPALSKARTQAKRVVCLGGMRQLVTAWMAYAENNDGKLVNCGQLPPPPVTEPYWCTPLPPLAADDEVGTGWPTTRYDWDLGLPYEERVSLMKRGALYRYCPNVKSYRCPEADRTLHRTYDIIESMNAKWGPPFHAEGEVAKRIGQIKKSKERIVFLEEKRLSGDTFIFPYTTSDISSVPAYWDGDWPNVMHGNGANFGFADGHADYHGWQCRSSLDLSKDSTPSYITYWNRAVSECKNLDGKWMENAVWGVTPP
jgi:L-fucose mutarotase